jgi:hypothetical protein
MVLYFIVALDGFRVGRRRAGVVMPLAAATSSTLLLLGFRSGLSVLLRLRV